MFSRVCGVSLHADDGLTDKQVSQAVGCHPGTVSRHRKRYTEHGLAAIHPREADRVYERKLDDPLVVSLRQQREQFTEGRHVHTTFAAALRYDYGLTDYRDARLDGETLRFFVEPAEVSVGGNDDTDSEEPLYGYYYWFALWELAEGVDPPSDLTVAFRTPSEANYDRTPRPTATGTAIDTHTPTTDESE